MNIWLQIIIALLVLGTIVAMFSSHVPGGPKNPFFWIVLGVIFIPATIARWFTLTSAARAHERSGAGFAGEDHSGKIVALIVMLIMAPILWFFVIPVLRFLLDFLI